jgi:hypothetical protein
VCSHPQVDDFATPPAAGGTSRQPQPEEYGAHLYGLEHRLAAMGGIPALGGAALPGLTPAAKTALRPTASPAAAELRRAAAGGAASPPAPAAPVLGSPLKQVQLRKAEGSVNVNLGQGAGVVSELEAALQKRRTPAS